MQPLVLGAFRQAALEHLLVVQLEDAGELDQHGGRHPAAPILDHGEKVAALPAQPAAQVVGWHPELLPT
jgi:hypothetical protein